MIKSRITEILGIEYPIIQGGMAWVANAELASAVSNAGGLGLIGAMNSNGEQLREQIKKIKQMTDKPYGVNVMLMSPYADEAARVIIEEGVPIVTTGAGSPGKYMEAWLEAGIKVIPVIASTAGAKRAERLGACAVVAEGGEAGGHIGELNTMALTPQVCDAVNIPVISAGGIADGRGIAAAFMLGAEGVQLGTRFLVAKECTVHQNFKDKVINAKDSDTITTGKRLGHPVRSLKTEFTRYLSQKEYDPSMSNEEFETLGVGAVRKASVEGDLKQGTFMAGQIAGLVNREQTCEEMITEMFGEAEELLKGGLKWVK